MVLFGSQVNLSQVFLTSFNFWCENFKFCFTIKTKEVFWALGDFFCISQEPHINVKEATYHFKALIRAAVGYEQKYSRLRYPLQKFSHLFNHNTCNKGRLKVILLLQVSSYDFEPTFIICFVKSTARSAQIKTDHQTFDM